jgi:hypothetical protein
MLLVQVWRFVRERCGARDSDRVSGGVVLGLGLRLVLLYALGELGLLLKSLVWVLACPAWVLLVVHLCWGCGLRGDSFVSLVSAEEEDCCDGDDSD